MSHSMIPRPICHILLPEPAHAYRKNPFAALKRASILQSTKQASGKSVDHSTGSLRSRWMGKSAFLSGWKRIGICIVCLVLLSGCAATHVQQHPEGDRGWSEYVQQGVADISKGNYKRALPVMNTALEREPRNPGLYYNRGMCHAGLKQYARAIEDFQKAIELEPSFVRAYSNLAWTYFSMGDQERALGELQRALQETGESAQIYYNLGLIHAKNGDYDRAVEDYSRAVELRPTMAEAFNNRGVARIHLQEYDKAIDDLSRAVALDPDTARYAYNQAIASEEQGRTDKAISLYTKALQKDHTFAPAYNNRGLLRFQMGVKGLGCQDLEQACKHGLCDRLRQLQENGECSGAMAR